MSWKADFVSKTLNQKHSAKIMGGYSDGYIDWEMNILGTIVFGLVAVFAVLFISIIYDAYKTSRNCGRWETKIVHQNAYTSWIYSGKTMIPIYHPAGDFEKSICVEVKK